MIALDRPRLAKLCGMFGSVHDGERANAAAAADRLVRGTGTTWQKILDTDQFTALVDANRRLSAENEALRAEIARLRAQSGGSIRRAWFEPTTTAEKINRALACSEDLSEWEQGFARSLAGWDGPLTDKQRDRLDLLMTKLRRIARAREHVA